MFQGKKPGKVTTAERKRWWRNYVRDLFVERIFGEHFDEDESEVTEDPHEYGISPTERARRLAKLK